MMLEKASLEAPQGACGCIQNLKAHVYRVLIDKTNSNASSSGCLQAHGFRAGGITNSELRGAGSFVPAQISGNFSELR